MKMKTYTNTLNPLSPVEQNMESVSAQTCGRVDERRDELRKSSLLLNVPGRLVLASFLRS